MQRPENLRQIIPRWREHIRSIGCLNLVVARDEYPSTLAIAKASGWGGVQVLRLPKDVQGIGAIRGWCVEIAHHNKDAAMIMSDDDIYPHHSANLNSMHAYAKRPNILGVGCVTSYHSLLLGHRKDMVYGEDAILATAGYGFRLFALNVKNAMKVGNFDPELDVCFEDAELMRCGVRAGMRWYLDPLVKANPLGKRFEAGGIAALTGTPEERAHRTNLNYEYCYSQWPKYMAEPPRKRMGWKKMLDDYWPGWREVTGD